MSHSKENSYQFTARQKFFQQYYGKLWEHRHVLTELEEKILDWSFGITDQPLKHSEIARKMNLKNKSQVGIIVRYALQKLQETNS